MFNKEIIQTEPCNNNILINKINNTSKLISLESQLDAIINKTFDKKNENLNEKLNLYKNAFDEAIRLGAPEMSKIMTKIHNGYIEIFQKMIGKLNTKTAELDNLANSKKWIITIEFNEVNKKSDVQNEEIRFLKQKLKDLHKASINSTNPSSQTNNKINNTNSISANKNSNLDDGIDIISNEHNEIISSKNKQ